MSILMKIVSTLYDEFNFAPRRLLPRLPIPLDNQADQEPLTMTHLLNLPMGLLVL